MGIRIINKKLKLLESILDFPKKYFDKDLWDVSTFPPKLRPEVRKHIIEKLFNFLKSNNFLNPQEWVKSIYLIGSITTYQYKKTSDIDVTIVIDYDSFRDYNVSFSNYSNEEIHSHLILHLTQINGENLKNTLHPLNYYILPPDRLQVVSDTVYDIYNDIWIKFETSETDLEKVLSVYEKYFPIALSWFQKIDLMISELKRDIKDFKELVEYFKELEGDEKQKVLNMLEKKKKEIIADLKSLAKDFKIIKQERNKKFEEFGEEAQYSLENIVYKFLEKYNYLEVLKVIYKFLKNEGYEL